jgi:hypothetical protein
MLNMEQKNQTFNPTNCKKNKAMGKNEKIA